MDRAMAITGCVVVFCVCDCAVAATNEWTKPASGAWEEPYWSLAVLPGIEQETVAISNPGWKAVAISANTTVLYPESLTLNNLIVDGPANSLNQLLLNWAGLEVALNIRSNLVVGLNGSVASLSSAIRARNFWLSGPALISHGSVSAFEMVSLGNESPAELKNESGSFLAGWMVVGNRFPARCTQSGGSSKLGTLDVRASGVFDITEGTLDATNINMLTGSTFNMAGGAVITTNLNVATNGAQFTMSGGEVSADRVALGHMTLAGGRLQCNVMQFNPGELTQTGGTNIVGVIGLPGDSGSGMYGETFSRYSLSGGTLLSGTISAGRGYKYGQKDYGDFVQSGGLHTNGSISLNGEPYRQGYAASYGSYTLSGGLIVSGSVCAPGGSFYQSGGTNITTQLKISDGGDYRLSGGQLITQDTLVVDNAGVNGSFMQSDGGYTVGNRLLLHAGHSGWGMLIRYSLTGGTLKVPSIEVGAGSSLDVSGGTIINSNLFTIHGAAEFNANMVTNSLFGKLQVTNAAGSAASLALTDHGGTLSPTVLRFQDSRDVPWSGRLEISGWDPNFDHIYVGTNSQGLTAAQLNQITFFVDGSQPALLLPDGELVPAVARYLPLGNVWLKTTNGDWEEPFWSLGQLPALSQGIIAITNEGWKAVAIGPATTANHPNSLSLETLILTAPPGSGNTLLLNYAGLDVPLSVRSDLIVDTGRSLDSHYSDMRVGRLYCRGRVAFMDGSTGTFGDVFLPGGYMEQIDARLVIGSLALTAGADSSARYAISAGRLYSGTLNIGIDSRHQNYIFFWQLGGSHTNAVTHIHGVKRFYQLDGGTFSSDALDINNGAFLQRGGTNIIYDLKINSGEFTLGAGELVTSNLTLNYYSGAMVQTGGVHQASDIELGYAANFVMLGGVVLHEGRFNTTGGAIWAGAVTNLQLGTLRVGGSTSLHMNSQGQWPNGGPTLLRFADSHQEPWTDRLVIWYWSQSSNPQGFGPDRLFFGSSAHGLTSEQLKKITFVNPTGLAPGEYPAKLLPSGELVPAAYWEPGGYIYLITPGGTVTITNYVGTGSDIAIPATIDGVPVTAIGGYAFYGNKNLTSVIIPEGVLTIGKFAFCGCTRLTNVIIPGSVTSIGMLAFYECDLTSVAIGPNITDIGAQAFSKCPRLAAITVSPDNSFYSSVDGVLFDKNHIVLIQCPSLRAGTYYIPSTVIRLEDYAFYYCTRLTDVRIPTSVLEIGNVAFGYCTVLTSPVIPCSVTNMGYYAYYGCRNLISFTVDPGNAFYSTRATLLFDKQQSTLIQCPPAKAGTYSIPNSVTNIAASAFRDCVALTKVTIPDNVLAIGQFSFLDCTGLTNAVIGNGITSLPYGSFRGCSKLTSVILGNSIRTLESSAFESCISLRSVIIPRKVTFLEGYVFSFSTNLARVYFQGDAPYYNAEPFYNTQVTVYYLPGTTGWWQTFAGHPTAQWFLSYPVILDFGSRYGLRSNRFGFVISWATNTIVLVETCTDLDTGLWSTAASCTLTNGSWHFTDPDPPSKPRHFYRVRP